MWSGGEKHSYRSQIINQWQRKQKSICSFSQFQMSTTIYSGSGDWEEITYSDSIPCNVSAVKSWRPKNLTTVDTIMASFLDFLFIWALQLIKCTITPQSPPSSGSTYQFPSNVERHSESPQAAEHAPPYLKLHLLLQLFCMPPFEFIYFYRDRAHYSTFQ